MSKKIIVVESSNDQYFVEAYVSSKNLSANIESSPFCKIDDYECLEGDSITKLTASLASLKNKSRKEEIQSIGIILDQDDKSIDKRLNQVNSAIKEAFGLKSDILQEPNKFEELEVDESISLKIGLYLQNINGTGNLETVLKTIKKGSSEHADCLDLWKTCIESKDLSIKDQDFNKFWIQIYQRYDQCSNRERKQAGRKCNNEASMKKDIWNFEHPSLDELKDFLEKM